MTKLVSEAEVVHSLKSHLIEQGLQGFSVENVLVDSQSSYKRSRYARDLEPMERIPIEGACPDMLCMLQHPTSPSVVGIEVKPTASDWHVGLAQARRYRRGVHYAYLAMPGLSASRQLEEDARVDGIGLLLRVGRRWKEVLKPAQPSPQPWTVKTVTAALHGIPATRRLQLNHPLNYLVIPWLAVRFPQQPLMDLLAAHWSDLGTSRVHAIQGAIVLGLVDRSERPTIEGLTVAELLSAVGFSLSMGIKKRSRLADEYPEVAAIARSVLLRQANVRLILEVLRERSRPLATPELFRATMHSDEFLARSLFLKDPSRSDLESLTGSDFNPSFVHKFRQVLWHAGLLATKMHKSAGKSGPEYESSNDKWELEERYLLARWSDVG
ncbi:MAG TPA: hypothetical protein VLQ93_22885 [Myxococcaceae bacterium]|nr:hypothetical protein [Myxococcaceae bacterium]